MVDRVVYANAARLRATIIKNAIKNIETVVGSIKETLTQSPLANLVYFRARAWIRSTFIYDLCVTENHIVFRGVLEFFVLLPVNVVRLITRFFLAMFRLSKFFFTGLFRFVFASYAALRSSAGVIATRRLFMIKLVSLSEYVSSSATVRTAVYNFLYLINYDSAWYRTFKLSLSNSYAYSLDMYVRTALLLNRSVVFSTAVSIFRLLFVDPICVLLLSAYIVLYEITRLIRLLLVDPIRLLFILVYIALYAIYNYCIVFIFSFLFFVAVFCIGGVVYLYARAVDRSLAVEKFHKNAVAAAPAVAGLLRTSARSVCFFVVAVADYLLLVGRGSGVAPRRAYPAGFVKLVLCVVFFYFLFVFEWLSFFDNYLALSMLYSFGLKRAWSHGTSVFRFIDDYIQYERGSISNTSNWWSALQTSIARIEYFTGGVAWSDLYTHHVEFVLIAAAIFCFAAYVFDLYRVAGALAVGVVRLSLFLVLISRIAAILPQSRNAISWDFLFLHMYNAGDWFSAVLSVLIGILLISVVPATECSGCGLRYIYLGVFSIISYAAITAPFCNDFMGVFLTTELFSICIVVLLLMSEDGKNRAIVTKYVYLSAVASAVLLVGVSSIYGATSIIDIFRLLYEAPSVRLEFGFGYVLFIAGLLFKLCSTPMLAVLETVYARIVPQLLVVLVVVIETAIGAFLFKILSIQLTSGEWVLSVQFSLLTILSVAILVSGLGAVRSSSLVGGLLYSSVQHISYIILSLLVSGDSYFSVVTAIFYLTFYTFNVFFVLLMLYTDRGAAGFVVRVVSVMLALSWAGIPPFIGFYSKLFLFTSLSVQSLWYVLFVSALGSICALIFYGRLIFTGWFVSAGGDRAVFADNRRRDQNIFIPAVTKITPIVASAVFVVTVWALPYIMHLVMFVATRFLCPTLRSTDHRTAFIVDAWGSSLEYRPNLQALYSWPSVYWTLPLLHFLSWTDTRRGGQVHSTSTEPAMAPILIPKPDSRYFWIGEWLMYPHQELPYVNEYGDLGYVFQRIYGRTSNKLQMLRHHYISPISHKMDPILAADRSPIRYIFAQTFYGPGTFEATNKPYDQLLVYDSTHGNFIRGHRDRWSRANEELGFLF